MLRFICISSTIPSPTRQSEAAKEITAGTAGTLTNIRRKKNISTHLSGAKRRHDRNPHQAPASLLASLICSPSSLPLLPTLRRLLRTNLKSTTKLASRQLPGCHQSISHNKSTRVGLLSTNCLHGGRDRVFPEQLH